jgi:hypothetical protein
MRFLLILLLAIPVCGADAPDKAWSILKAGCADRNAEHRAQAVQALGLLPGDAEAQTLAVAGLSDPDARVRRASAAALGQMHATTAAGDLKKALNDPAGEVVIAAADSLVLLHDPAGFEVDYEILTQQKKTGTSLKEQEHEFLHNPKAMEKMGFEQGIGFIPYGSMTLTAFHALTKDSLTPERAMAARALAKDPDPQSGAALVVALNDDKWLVRTAAAAAIAERNDPKLLQGATQAMDDDSPIVSYTAAAAVLHLGHLPPRPPIKRRIHPMAAK